MFVYGFILILHFVPKLVQTPIVFFRIFEQLGVECILWERVERRAISLDSRLDGGTEETGV